MILDVYKLQATLSLDTSAYTEALGKAKEALTKFGEKAKGSSDPLKNTGENFKKSASVFKTAAETLSKAGDTLKSVGTKLKDSGKNVEDLGKKFSFLSGGAVAGITAAVKTTADFDEQMSKVSAISGATGDDFDALRDKAREMGAKTKFSATEAGQAMEYMGMAGWKTQEMIEGIPGIMNLAAASGESLATTSDIVTDALTAFGKTAGDSGRLADIMAAASTNANTNVSLMGETFKYVAPVAGALGMGMEDTAVAIGLMANSGIKGSMAGTSLRSILTRMAKPTKESSLAMTALGVSLDDGNGKMYSLMEIMEQMREGFQSKLRIPAGEVQEQLQELNSAFEAGEYTQKEYDAEVENLMNRAYGAEGALMAEYAAMLAGKNGMSGLLAVVNASDADFEKLTTAVNNSSEKMVKTTDGAIMPMSQALAEGKGVIEEYNGAAEQMASVMQDNLNGQLTILKSQLQEFAISIGDIIMPKIREIVTVFQNWVDKLNNLDEKQKNAIVTIGLVVAAIAPALIVVGKVISGIGSISSAIGSMLKHPILTTIALVVTAVATLYATNEDFRNGVNNLWNNYLVPFGKFLAGAFLQAWEGLKQFWEEKLSPIISNLGRILKNVWDNVFVKFGEYIGGKFKEAWEGLKSLWDEKITPAIETISGAVKKFWQNVVVEFGRYIASTFTRAWENLKKFWEETITPAIGKLQDAFKKFKEEYLEKVANYIGGAFKKAWVAIKEFWEGGWKDAVTKVQTAFKTLKEDYLEKIASFLTGVFKKAWEKIKEFFTEDVPKAVQAVTGVFKGLWNDVLVPLKDLLVGAFKDAWDAIKDLFETPLKKAVDTVKTLFDDLWNKILVPLGEFIKETFLKAWEAIKDFFDGDGSKAVGTIKDALDGLYSLTIQPIATFISGTFTEAWEGIKSFFERTIQPTIENLQTAFKTFKEEHLDKIAEYVSGAFKTAFDGIKELFNTKLPEAIGWVQDKFDYFKNWVLSPLGTFVRDTFASAFDNIKTLFNFTLPNAIEWVKGKFGDLKEGMRTVHDYVSQFLQPIISTLGSTFQTVRDWFIQPFVDFINITLFNAISHIGGWVVDGINSINNLLTWVRGAVSEINGMIGRAAQVGYNNLFPGGNPASGYYIGDGLGGMAEGGTLRSGSVWVGEEAPEILTVKNGVATVTPVAGNGRHSPVGGNNFTFNIYAQPGQDEEAIARAVQRQFVRWEKQKGAAYVG